MTTILGQNFGMVKNLRSSFDLPIKRINPKKKSARALEGLRFFLTLIKRIDRGSIERI